LQVAIESSLTDKTSYVTFKRDPNADGNWMLSKRFASSTMLKGLTQNFSPQSPPLQQQMATKILSSTRTVTVPAPPPVLPPKQNKTRKFFSSPNQLVPTSILSRKQGRPQKSRESDSPAATSPVESPSPSSNVTPTSKLRSPSPIPPSVHEQEYADVADSSPNRGVPNMQDMLMNIVLGNGGSAPFERIYLAVEKNWSTMRRNNTVDCRRAILASLSHNPPGNFRKDPKKDGWWTVAPRAMVWAKQLIKDDKTNLLSLKKAPDFDQSEDDER